jgi:hypothetical protein
MAPTTSATANSESVAVVLPLGVVVAQLAGIVAIVSGLGIAQAFIAGGVSLAMTATVALLVKDQLTK